LPSYGRAYWVETGQWEGGGFGHYIQIDKRECMPGSCRQLPAGLMGQGIVTIKDAC